MGVLCMEPKELFPMGRCSRLTIINNHTQKITVRYQPLLSGRDEATSLIPASLGSSIIPMPRVTTLHTEVEIGSRKKTKLKQLLIPFVTIKIGGFKSLENLRIVRSDIPLTVHAMHNNEIRVTQAEQECATMRSLHLSIQSRSSKYYKKENSEEDCCAIQ